MINNTTPGWFRNEADEITVRNVEKYSGITLNENKVNLVLSRLAYTSIADTVIIPLQDLSGLDESARMNTPSSGSNNWKSRLLPHQLNEEVVNN